MNLNRRSLLKGGTLVGAGLLSSAQFPAVQAKESVEAQLKIASQEGVIPGESLREKVLKMEEWGFVGLEVWGGGLAGRVSEIRDALQGTGVQLSAICAGFEGAIASHDEGERKKAMESIKAILAPAGDLGATGMIIVPAFNNQTQLDNREARQITVDAVHELGNYAHEHGTRLLLEPLNRGEAFLLRQLADGAAICRDANSPGACLMGDFYHMGIEETSDMGAFLSAGPYLHHVHLASRKRNLPGQDDRDFTDGFRGLKMIGYTDFCSLECGVIGDRETEIPKIIPFLREQWNKA